MTITDAMLDADIAILAKKGRGKTYTAKGLVERLLASGRRVLILDPLSTWWGLKSSADGEREGFPVAVFGGPHGDMPMTEAMARPLARIIAENNLPTVVDLGSLPKAAWQRIVRDMLDELFQKNRDPLWIVLEEADIFAPQQPREGDSAAVLGEVDRIARRGRAFGFRLISITQRPARLHKDVLTQLSTLIALGVTSPQDREAIKSWVEGNADRDKAREVMDSLASLPVGEGWVWAPDFDILERTKFPLITTLDTSATPRAGDRRIEPKRLAQIDLGPLKAALEVPIEKAKAVVPALDVLERSKIWNTARDEGYADGYAAGLEDGERTGRAKERARIMVAMEKLFAFEDVPDEKTPALVAIKHEPAPRQTPKPEPYQMNGLVSDISPTATKIIGVIKSVHPRGISFSAAAKRAGASSRSSAYRVYRQQVLTSHEVQGDEARLVAISGLDGRSAPEMGITAWRSRLTRSQAAILDVLSTSASPLDRDTIADLSGISRTSSGLGSSLKELRDLELIEQQAQGWVLAPELREGVL